MSKDTNSLAHSTWNCKYHIVFVPKYRRKVFYGQKRKEIGAILRRLCEYKNVNIIEAEVCPDHVQKHFINISAVYKSIFKIPTLRVLVYRILCRYSREEYKENKRIYCEPI